MPTLNKKIRFGLIGGLNTCIDLGVFLLLTGAGMQTIVANTISTSLGMLSSFILNRKFTFGPSGGKKHQEIGKFLGVTLVGLWILQPIVIYLVLFGGSHLFGLAENQMLRAVGKFLSIGVSLVWNYCWYNNYVFKTAPKAE